MVAAFGAVVTYVFRDHVKNDDTRFAGLKAELKDISDRQVAIADKMADNHTEVMQQFISQGQHAATLASVAEALTQRAEPPK